MTVREAAVGDANEVVIGDEQISVGSYLERFLFRRPQQRLRVGELSGGERARVCLARLLAQKSNLLLLDEPTNDLDVETLSALESMLLDFGGCVILVSHDRWMLDRVATSILAFEGDGRVELHIGGYSDYRARRAREMRREPRASGRPAETATRSQPKPTSIETRPRRLTHAERLELDGLFEEIAAAEARVAELQGQLADPEVYQGFGEGMAAVRSDLEGAESEVARLTARWEDLEEREAAFQRRSDEG
jgi:ATP-binding cassette subfamily F protein uup